MTQPPPAPDVVLIGVDLEGLIVHTSEAVDAVLGWKSDELVGRPLTTLIPKRFRRRHLEGFSRFVDSGDLTLVGRPLRMPARRGDRGEEDIELVLSMPSRSDPASVIGVIRRAGRFSTSTQFRLTSELRSAMADSDPLDKILARCLELVGRELGARLGTVWVNDMFHDGLVPMVAWESEPGTIPEYVEHRMAPDTMDGDSHVMHVFADGRSSWIDDVAAVEPAAATWAGGGGRAASYIALVSGRDAVGVVELVHAAGRDLTIEHQQALSFLGSELGGLIAARIRGDMEAANQRRVQLALESRGVATWSYRLPSGVMTGDDRLAELYGLPPDETASHFERYSELIFPEDRQRTRDEATAAIERGERFEFRYRVRRPDGKVVWLEGAGVPIVAADGETREITGVCYDVTAEMRARSELEEQARFAALSADVGRAFVGDEPLADKLHRTTYAIVEQLDAAFARIWTIDDETSTLELRASSGLYTHLDGGHARIRIGEYKIGRIAASLEPHLTNDVVNDEHVSDPEWAKNTGMKAFAGYPLVIGGRCVGVLAMFARHELPASTLRALATVSDTVAVGIEQSRAAEEVMALYGESHRNAATLEAALRDRAHVAEVLQASLVPRSLPEVAGFAVHACYRAGVEEVGGDFYDVLLVGRNRWAFLIGDICGRGAEAARLTALARHSLRLAVMLGHSPAEALGALNQALLRSDNDGRFCTAVCGVIFESDDGAALIDVGVAGHPAPLVVRADGTVFAVEANGTLLGVFPDAAFAQSEERLLPGDTIVTYTDGVVEARRNGEMFGVERLRAVVSQLATEGAEAIVAGVLEAVTEFDESASQDDLAILAIQRVRERVHAVVEQPEQVPARR